MTGVRRLVREDVANATAKLARASARFLARTDTAALASEQSLPVYAARDAATGPAFARWFDNAHEAAAWLAASDLSAGQKPRLLAPGK